MRCGYVFFIVFASVVQDALSFLVCVLMMLTQEEAVRSRAEGERKEKGKMVNDEALCENEKKQYHHKLIESTAKGGHDASNTVPK